MTKSKYKGIRINGVKHDEHRFIMENNIGRKLDKNEIVHHVNGDSHDNRIENLQVMSRAEHARLHHAGRVEPEWVRKQKSERMLGCHFGTPRKLTEDEVRFIRSNYKPRSKEYGARALSKKYGLSHSEISRMARGISYKDVK